MLATALLLAAAFVQGGAAPATDCSVAMARGTSPATAQVCLAEAEFGRAQSVPKNSDEWRRHVREAASLYKRVLTFPADDVIKGTAIERLLVIFDVSMLNDPPEMLAALGELIRLRPTEVDPLFRLARYQEAQGSVESAEETLLSSRRVQPEAIEPFRMLAQFYARRAGAMHTRAMQDDSREKALPGTPDKNGVYQVGGGIVTPRRFGNPVPPPEASAAGIGGAVIAEIIVNEAGIVTDARILKSNPVLDEAVLQAVREWRYDPATVDGKPVPVRMVVTVNFPLSRSK
jgi:TonB family protein